MNPFDGGDNASEAAKKLGVSAETIRLTDYWRQNSRRAAELPLAIVLWTVEQALDYQLEYIYDDARRRAWGKSRQIGGSWTVGLDTTLGALCRREQIIVSASTDLTQENIQKVVDVCEAIERTFDCRLLSTDRKDTKNKSIVTLVTGKRVIGRPASPRTVRSFTGDVTLDECGVMPFDRQIYKGASGVMTRGDYRLSVLGTPFGADGVFYDVCEGKFRSQFSQHRTTILQAVAMGAPVNIADIRGMYTDEDWEQEFLVNFLASGLSYFLLARIREAEERGERYYRDSAMMAELGGVLRAYMGVDVGRRVDLTALCLWQVFKSNNRGHLPIEVMRKTPFDEQETKIVDFLREHRPKRCHTDAGGLGMDIAERLEKRFPSIVKGLDFSKENVKRAMVENMRHELDSGRLLLHPDDPETAYELRLIRREFTRHGKIRYVADRYEDGHADRATALMLAALAEREPDYWFDFVDEHPALIEARVRERELERARALGGNNDITRWLLSQGVRIPEPEEVEEDEYAGETEWSEV